MGKRFLTEIAAPSLLYLPYRYWVYVLIVQVPESLVGVVLFIRGAFSVGWSCVAGWFGACPETTHLLREDIRRLLLLGLFAYLRSAAMMSVELALK